MDKSIESLLTPDEVAEIFNIKTSTVYEMVREGKLQPVNLGIKKYRFNKSYILSMCEPTSENKSWNELRLERENERLKIEIDKLKGDLGAITSLSTRYLREE